MTPQQFQKQLQKHQKDLTEAFRRTIPVKIGVEMEHHFRDNFRKGGFVDGGLHRWKPAKRINQAKGASGQYGTLLSSRNHLYNSIKHRWEPYTAIVETDVPYARAHNEGTNNAGRGHKTRLPKRQFIGDSRELNRKVQDLIRRETDKIMKR